MVLEMFQPSLEWKEDYGEHVVRYEAGLLLFCIYILRYKRSTIPISQLCQHCEQVIPSMRWLQLCKHTRASLP